MIYLFQYDAPGLLHGMQRDTTALTTELQSFPAWAQCFNTTWLIATHEVIQDVERKLERHLRDSENRLLVPVTSDAYTGRLPREIWEWITDCRLRGY